MIERRLRGWNKSALIGLSKSFGVRQVFNKVSFEIKHGERVGLVGPNGAGKSTLMKCLLGIEEYDEGQVVKDSATTIGYLQQDINFRGRQFSY